MAVMGFIDVCMPHIIDGWAWDNENPDRHIELGVHVDNKIVARVIADQYREDLWQCGDGTHAFYYAPSEVIDVEKQAITVVVCETGASLPFSRDLWLGLTQDNNYYCIPDFVAGKRVLEIGCNDGRLARHILNNFQIVDYCGIDPWRAPKQTVELRPRWRPGDIERRETLPLNEKWNVVVCFDVLYHLVSPLQSLLNLHDLTSELLVLGTVVVPEGESSGGIKHPITPHKMKGPVMRFEPGYAGDKTNFFYPTEACLIRMLEWVGFESVERKYYYKEAQNGRFHDRACYYCWKTPTTKELRLKQRAC